jgi:rRNA small subunit pseudouridine methyltransferase Nep1
MVVPSGLLNLVLAESALELVPREILSRPAIVSDSKRRGKGPGEILLDRSFHHSAMHNLKDSEKRGRPDLVHVTLLSVTGTPLYLDGGVRVFVHTYPDVVLEIEEKTRIPKNYLRFRGLMEDVLSGGSGGRLIKESRMGIRELSRSIAADRSLGLSVRGKESNAVGLAADVARVRDPCFVIGGFPHGHFTKETLSVLDGLVRIDQRPLEAHVVASRVIYEFEKAERASTIKN